MRAFARRRGRYVAHIEPAESSILAGVVADTAALLGERPGLSEEERAVLVAAGWVLVPADAEAIRESVASEGEGA